MHKKKATVYAYKSEIDVWWNDGPTRLEQSEAAARGRQRRLGWSVAAGLTLLSVGMVGFNVAGVRDRLFDWLVAGEITSSPSLPRKRS